MNWIPATVGDACLPTSQADPGRRGNATFRYVDIAGIDRDSKTIYRADEYTCLDAPNRARKVIQSSDVLVSTVRPNLNAVAMVPDELDGEIASTGFSVLRANPAFVQAKFLFYWVQHREFTDFLIANATGASYPAVSDSIVKRARLPLPTTLEQSRIVELLDEADRLRRLRRGADAKVARVLPALFLQMFGDPATNPMGWSEKPLSRVIKSIEAGWSASSEGRPCISGELGVLKVSAVTSGKFRPEENKAVLGEVDSASLVTPRRGDLIFSRANTRELVAATCIVEDDFPDLFLSDKLWRLTPMAEQATPHFLKELFWQGGIRDKFRAASSGSSGSMLNISQDAMLRTIAPIPPIHLQERFQRLAWSVLTNLNRTNSAAQKLETTWAILLQRAFSGELTTKWRETHQKDIVQERQLQAHAMNQQRLSC
jgi:type I restriction enzyme S subunit